MTDRPTYIVHGSMEDMLLVYLMGGSELAAIMAEMFPEAEPNDFRIRVCENNCYPEDTIGIESEDGNLFYALTVVDETLIVLGRAAPMHTLN